MNAPVLTLAALPPCAQQSKAHPARSSRYVHINTRRVVEQLGERGFKVAAVQVTRSKHADPLFARHQIDMRNPLVRTQPGPTGRSRDLRFLFSNSHDGTSSAQLRLGIYELVCSNGLVVGTDYATATIRHSGDAAAEVLDRVALMAQQAMPLFAQIHRWEERVMTLGQQRKFAELAAVLRWGDPHRYPVEAVLRARRAEDDNPTLWAVMNRVQENCMLGGLRGKSPSGRKATSRPLSDINNSNSFNSQLWQLAAEFAEL